MENNKGCMTCLSKEGILVINRVFQVRKWNDFNDLLELSMSGLPLFEEVPFRMCSNCFNKKFRLGYEELA